MPKHRRAWARATLCGAVRGKGEVTERSPSLTRDRDIEGGERNSDAHGENGAEQHDVNTPAPQSDCRKIPPRNRALLFNPSSTILAQCCTLRQVQLFFRLAAMAPRERVLACEEGMITRLTVPQPYSSSTSSARLVPWPLEKLALFRVPKRSCSSSVRCWRTTTSPTAATR